MKETGLVSRSQFDLKGKGQYVLAFSAIAGMLYFVGFPLFLVFFFGLLTFFVWKSFSGETRGEAKQIFDFYLTASEIIRRDHRRWFGFEIVAAISKGEALLKQMASPPPLVYFALGALYQKAGDHAAAVKYLGAVAGESSSDESSIVVPSNELVEYARILRKVERNPGDAPLTSAALRHLERARRNNAGDMLRSSRAQLQTVQSELDRGAEAGDEVSASQAYDFAEFAKNRRGKSEEGEPEERRTISQLLHDIYDEKEG